MSHHDQKKPKEQDDKGEGRKKKPAEEQAELIENLMGEVRTLDSEVDLLKQKMNAIIREMNVLKKVVLTDRKQIKELESEEEKDKERFEGLANIIRRIKGI